MIFPTLAQNFNWVKTLGNSLNTEITRTQTDNQGNIYISGGFIGTIDFDLGNGTYNLTSVNTTYGDNYLLKLDPNGNFLWVKQWNLNPTNNSNFSAGGPTSGFNFKVTQNGIFITGAFTGVSDFDPGTNTNTLKANGTGWWDAFILKLDLNGNYVWAQNYGSSIIDCGRSIDFDSYGNIYSIGYFSGTADFDFSNATNNLTSNGGADSYILKLDPNGNFLWVKKIGGSANDDLANIEIDKENNIYYGGGYYASSTIDMDPGNGTYNLTSNGNWDVSVGKMDYNGNFLWAINLGNSSQNSANFKLNKNTNEILIFGEYNGTIDVNPETTVNNIISNGGNDVFITSLSTSGNYLWSVSFGGLGDETITPYGSLDFDSNGQIILTGTFNQSVDFDPSSGLNIINSLGMKDIYVTALSPKGDYISTKTFGGIGNDIGSGIATFPNDNVFLTGLYSNTVDFDPSVNVSNLTSSGQYDTYILNLKIGIQCTNPTATITPQSSTTFCQGGNVLLNATTGTNYTYQWYNNGQLINGATSNLYKATTSGTYTVSIINGACNASSQPTNITVNPLPTAIITHQGKIPFCQGSSVNLIASGGISYLWNNGSTATSITAYNAGAYYVDVFNSFGCKSNAWLDISVYPIPTVTINKINSFTLKNENPYQLIGNPSGGNFSGEGVSGSLFYPSISSLGKKTITYNYTSPQGCVGSNSTSTIVVDSIGNVCSIYDTVSILKIKIQLTTGIKANETTSLTVYPNPTSDLLIISTDDVQALTNYKYQIIDMSGKEVYNALVTSNETQISLKSISSNGTYILHIIDGNGKSISENKIIVE